MTDHQYYREWVGPYLLVALSSLPALLSAVPEPGVYGEPPASIVDAAMIDLARDRRRLERRFNSWRIGALVAAAVWLVSVNVPTAVRSVAACFE